MAIYFHTGTFLSVLKPILLQVLSVEKNRTLLHSYQSTLTVYLINSFSSSYQITYPKQRPNRTPYTAKVAKLLTQRGANKLQDPRPKTAIEKVSNVPSFSRTNFVEQSLPPSGLKMISIPEQMDKIMAGWYLSSPIFFTA